MWSLLSKKRQERKENKVSLHGDANVKAFVVSMKVSALNPLLQVRLSSEGSMQEAHLRCLTGCDILKAAQHWSVQKGVRSFHLTVKCCLHDTVHKKMI